ncbi:MAG TPA: AMP-binding protein, partial [Candidatus Deferrimicrobium sp.]|nr:AMP-binding protein [Candidatus Deferrimicrobium sp.]
MTNHFIGIMADDSPQLLVGLLGILKSGNVFVPINPTFPAERIHFIIKDCHIRLLLTDKANQAKAYEIAAVSPVVTHLLCLDDMTVDSFTRKQGIDYKYLQKEETCYVIYTSGSTGRPKGVPINHRNLISLFCYSREYLDLGAHTRVMQNLSYTFDFGVFEIFTTLLFGGRLFTLNKSVINDFSYYAHFIDCRQINTLHTTPVFINNLAGSSKKMPSLKLIHFGGEQLTGQVIMNIVDVISPMCCLYNGYGPTEATINCTYFFLARAKLPEMVNRNIPIGHPCDWHEIYIMDCFFNPQPIGTVGEMYIAGPGLSQGY